jgi:DNA-binding transcriptional ArsR family regulator
MSILSEIFGDCPQIKIVETFAENYNDKLFVADIVRMTDVSKVTVSNHINKLLEEGIIEKKEKTGPIQFYQLNMNNPKAKIILLLERFIVSERLEKLIIEGEDEIGEEIEEQGLTSSRVKRSVPDVSIRTKYKEENTVIADVHPFLYSSEFTKPILNVGAGYSTIISGETCYEERR